MFDCSCNIAVTVNIYAIYINWCINQILAWKWPTLTHTHALESNETKTRALECIECDQKLRISHVKNVNKRKNRLTPVKLESKKQHKKIAA